MIVDLLPAEQCWICRQAGAEDTQADLDNRPHAWLDIGPWKLVSTVSQHEPNNKKPRSYMVRLKVLHNFRQHHPYQRTVLVTYRLPSENTPISCNFLALLAWRRHRNGIGRQSAMISVRAFNEPKIMKAVFR